jgi:hypothetical protein
MRPPRGQDQRSYRLEQAYSLNAPECGQLGHEFVQDIGVNGDYVCGYCRQLRAFWKMRDIDKTREPVS